MTPVESQKAQIIYFWGNIIRPTNGSLVGVEAVGDAPHVGGRRGAQVLRVEEGGEGRPHTALQHIGAMQVYSTVYTPGTSSRGSCGLCHEVCCT